MNPGMGLTRKEREYQRRRSDILKVAEEVFAEKGYVSTTMEEIAHRAEFAVGSLYKFFANKLDLYKTVLIEKIDLMGVEVNSAMLSAVTPRRKIEACFRTRLNLFWQYPLFFRLLFNEVQTTVPDPRAGFVPELWKRYDEFLEDLTGIFRKGIAEGEFRLLDVSMLVMTFEGLIRNYLAEMSRLQEPVRIPEHEDALLVLFLEGASAPRSS